MVFFLGGDCRTWAALKSPLAVQASAIYISLAPPPLPYRREMDDGSSPNRSLHQEKKHAIACLFSWWRLLDLSCAQKSACYASLRYLYIPRASALAVPARDGWRFKSEPQSPPRKKARHSVPFFLVETAGLEPVTPCMSSKYSNQLS